MGDLDGTPGSGSDRGRRAYQTRNRPAVRTIESTSGRTVFSEAGTIDAWIATDYTTEVRR
ncbi:hypothetical protein [Halorientalis halophila]|uniref:hypothetical protein n=1 Tax=Halorientalis halophila TaxID=3108499 RepID=UPI003008A76B